MLSDLSLQLHDSALFLNARIGQLIINKFRSALRSVNAIIFHFVCSVVQLLDEVFRCVLLSPWF